MELSMIYRLFLRLLLVLIGASASLACVAADGTVAGTPATNDVASLALSPDGMTLAVTGRHQGRLHLWLKPVGAGQARPLPGTEDAVYPFWSPDGTKVAFFAEDEIRQVDIQSGKITTLRTGAGFPAGGTWGKDGVILFATHGQYIVWRMSETGGGQTPVATLDGPDQFSLVHPYLLPDGASFLYYTHGRNGERGVYQGILGSNVTRRLIDSDAAAVFASGKLYYVQNGDLHARSFDPVLGDLGTDDKIIAKGMALGGRGAIALASNGKQIVYRTGSGGAKQLVWYDRAGKQLGKVGEPFDAGGSAPSFSPDGKSALISYMGGSSADLGIIDLATGKITPVASGPETDIDPVWSIDGASVIFASKRTSTVEMYRQEVGKPQDPAKVFTTIGLRRPMDLSRDGQYLFYRMNTPDVWALDLRTNLEIPIIRTGSPRTQFPQISPDGRWIAFQSDTSGSTQVHLHGPFAPPALGTTSPPLSVNGGGWVRWSGDGKELFYVEADGTLMSIKLSFSEGGKTFTASTPAKLFTPPIMSGPENNAAGQQYMVMPDGQRFLVVTAPESEVPVYLHGP
jgi:Tol biopolymer transport system component